MAGAVVFRLLDPLPFGFFTAALIFDAVYADGGAIFWVKSAAWLIAIGLLFAVLPRLINLAQVLFTGGRPRAGGAVVAFWLNLFAIVAAIVNAFVHSRDAFAAMPEGLVLSIATVALIVVSNVVLTLQSTRA